MSKYVEPFSPKLRNDEFGNLAPYRNGRPHRGQDWSAKELATIKASATGTVNIVWPQAELASLIFLAVAICAIVLSFKK